MIKSLHVALVHRIASAVSADTPNYLPFRISLSTYEAIEIRGLRIQFSPSGSNNNATIKWALIQKNETEGESTSGTSDPLARQDHDILIRGAVSNFNNATVGYNDYPWKETIWLPIPIVIPRSPTLEVSSTGITQDLHAELYYTKTKLKDHDLRILLKQWIGRKQDVVTNVPRVIDE